MLRGVQSSSRKDSGTEVSASTWAVLTDPQKFHAMANSADIVQTAAADEEEEGRLLSLGTVKSLVKSPHLVVKAVHA
jgi:hypothetical protein